MIHKIRIPVLLLSLVLFQGNVHAQEWNLSSPDKKINIRISNTGSLSYSVSYDKQTVINDSPLGIQRDDQQFSGSLKFVEKNQNKIKEPYTLLVGKKLKSDNPANELTLVFENGNKEKINLIFRAYNDGIAFRYKFPTADGGIHKITEEHSGFAIPKEAKAWIQPYDLNVRNKPCYETYYEDGITPGSPSPNPAGWAFPALFNIGKVWMLVSEAGLDETYCATHLEDKQNNGIYTIRFPEKEEVTSNAEPEPESTLPWTTPWRLVVIGPSLNTLQQTTLVTDLCPASKIKDTSWIKPGRASWSWWSNGGTPRDFDVQKKYIDFNAEMGWEYVLIDAGWPKMENGNMEDLVKYANGKGVGIFLWYHSGMGREKDTLSMANLMAFPDERKKELERIKQWGVKGIKVDFFDSDKQPVIKRYFDIMTDAAAYKIMVNFHGSTLPRGWERTYPHLMSMESVKGAEGYGNQKFCEKAPAHNTILPFTRNVVGSMDYTPVTFTNKREAIRQTTFAHELALSIVFESGVFHFADNMSSYQALPDAPKKFLMNVPVTWDETQYLAGIPGKFVVTARRKGNHWYIGGINGQDIPQEVSFDLPVQNGQKSIQIITDGSQPGTFTTETLEPDGKRVKIKIAAKGGFVTQVN
jgi:alpha-glucosidase